MNHLFKKVSLVFLSFCLVLGLSACGESGTSKGPVVVKVGNEKITMEEATWVTVCHFYGDYDLPSREELEKSNYQMQALNYYVYLKSLELYYSNGKNEKGKEIVPKGAEEHVKNTVLKELKEDDEESYERVVEYGVPEEFLIEYAILEMYYDGQSDNAVTLDYDENKLKKIMEKEIKWKDEDFKEAFDKSFN